MRVGFIGCVFIAGISVCATYLAEETRCMDKCEHLRGMYQLQLEVHDSQQAGVISAALERSYQMGKARGTADAEKRQTDQLWSEYMRSPEHAAADKYRRDHP